ncbi:MAG TPA: hypothetical protein VM661_02200 [Candidatus Sulfotelmatobacter sp.]|jgi:hypothetical protein|nr:hypothetical protein [Candidatus Sulfotelmatobacter sp.]
MTACILQFPVRRHEEPSAQQQGHDEAESEYESSSQENLRGMWLSLRYLEDEAIRLGEGELALLIGMASLTARDLALPSQVAE